MQFKIQKKCLLKTNDLLKTSDKFWQTLSGPGAALNKNTATKYF